LPDAAPNLSPRDAASWIIATLRAAGHLAYLAGGCVRDELLGREPDDYDVATDATPDRLRALFRRTDEIGASFGVVLVKTGPHAIEVATFRADGPYSDRRRPDTVRFSDPRSDAERRDFTVNALLLDPDGGPGPDGVPSTTTPRGTVIDYIGGMADLAARTLRAVGDPERRLAEDHLRALRAARLAAKLGFTLDPATAAAIRRHAAELAGVSRERIGDEVRRLLAHPSRTRGVELLEDLGLAGPSLLLTSPPTSGPRTRVASLHPEAPITTTLAAWLIDLGHLPTMADAKGDPTSAILQRTRRALCLSNDEGADLRDVLRGVALLRGSWAGASMARQKRAAAAAWFAEALSIVRAEDPVAAEPIADRVAQLVNTTNGLAPTPWVTGDDLIAMGLRPGPGFKAALERAYDDQLEEKIVSRAEALELARARGVGVE